MSRKTKAKPSKPPKVPRGPLLERKTVVRLLKVCLVIAGLIAVGAGMRAMETHVLDLDAQGARAVVVRVTDPPEWMPAALVDTITRSLTPKPGQVAQRKLTRDVHARALDNPWVRTVHYVWRRPSDDPTVAVLELKAEFHRPIARINVRNGLRYLSKDCQLLTDRQSVKLSGYCFVSEDGTVLPGDQVPQYVARIKPTTGGPARPVYYLTAAEVPFATPVRAVHYITIHGPPELNVAVGDRWVSRDLLDGLRLTEMVLAEPWSDQITVVDVRNHNGRIDRRQPHLRMWAQRGSGRATDIRFGQFPRTPGDYVVPTDVKWAQLNRFVKRNHGQLAGTRAYVDLRFDNLHVSVN